MKQTKWSFQLLPAVHGVIAHGFRMDAPGETLEADVNVALPFYFRFHKIGKLVIRLGVSERSEKDYLEVLGVATKQYPNFDLHAYTKLVEEEKKRVLQNVVIEVFEWLCQNFPDSQCFAAALEKLGWNRQFTPDEKKG